MEPHPVPKNVTSFEFRLVGDMTLKQFVYLASGLAIAYITFIAGNEKAPIIAWPIIIVSALLGAAFAFMPISDRPLDHWVKVFLRAVFRPTQFKYSSKKFNPETGVFVTRLNSYLLAITAIEKQAVPLNKPAATIFSNLAPAQSMIPVPKHAVPETPRPEPPKNIPSSKELVETVELAKQAQIVQTKIIDTEHHMQEIKTKAAQVGSDPKEFVDKFQKILSDLNKLNAQASDVSRQLAVLSKKPSTAKGIVIPAEKVETIKSIILTSIPNIINGIITDPEGNYLEGAIIVAHDKQGIPVRALKSNKLGQFIAATPLPDGIYELSTEKEGFYFDTVEANLKSEVLQPMMLIAKKQ